MSKQVSHPKSVMLPGFTLIEVLIVIGTVSIVLTVLVALFVDTIRTFSLTTTQAHLQTETTTALDRIVRQSREANTVVDTYDSYVTSNQVLILRLGAIDQNLDILPSTYDYAIYRRNPTDTGKLEEIIVAAPASARDSQTRTILRNVSQLSFDYTDRTGTSLASNFSEAKEVTIDVASTKTIRSNLTASTTQSEAVTLRNK